MKPMAPRDAAAKAEKLRRAIDRHNSLYYQEATP